MAANTAHAPAASVWWSLGLAGVVAVCAAVAAVSGVGPGRIGLATAVLAAYAVLFVLVGRRVAGGSAGAWLVLAATAVAAASTTAIAPEYGITQVFAHPLVWVLAGSRGRAVAATAATAAAVFVGFSVSASGEAGWLATAATTQAVSFGFSVVMGLWVTGVYASESEKARLLAELTDAQERLAAMNREAGTAEERERLSRELHDTIAQSLAGTVMLAQRARRRLAGGDLDDAGLELVEDAARQGLAETRALVAGMAPVELEGGLPAALGEVAARFTRETGVPVALDVHRSVAVSREAQVALLRAAQEGLANARRHAAARSVALTLAAGDGAATLAVIDDGRGFDPAAATDGFGIAGLRARLALVGGTLEVDGSPRRAGLRVRVPAEAGA